MADVPNEGKPVLAPKPVTYEIVKTTFYPESQPPQTRAVHIREKIDRPNWGYSSMSSQSFHMSEQVSEESLTGLLTRIFQALEQLGMEFVITPATAQNVEFRKKPVSIDSVPREQP